MHNVCLYVCTYMCVLSMYRIHFFLTDIRERFHYFILLSIVMMRNLAQFQWNLGRIYIKGYCLISFDTKGASHAKHCITTVVLSRFKPPKFR